MVQGINHVTFAVRDLNTSFAFYVDLLGLQPVARWYKGAYLQAGNDWICLALDPDTRVESRPEYTHLAFSVEPEHFRAAVARPKSASVPVWQQNKSPGGSVYFLDPNGHKLELHVSDLQARLNSLQAKPPQDLVLFPTQAQPQRTQR